MGDPDKGEHMTKCTNCGAEKWSLVERLGALETWRCESCGHEETVHVYDPRLDPKLPPDLAPVFTLVARWLSKPTARQISELQKLFPRLRSVSGVELMKKAHDQSTLELGRFIESEVSARVHQLESLGVEIERIPIASN
jgi:hypothetical protein